jgi:adenine-specific DNA-methyltransferase
LSLTDREKEHLKGLIDAGQPLPPRYKAVLFDQPQEAELIWAGKTSEVTNVVLPFQSIEQIDEPRAETSGQIADLFAFDAQTGRQSSGWTNKLIWGDNKLVLASLKNGPLRREIEAAGGLKVVYIDPPFDVGADFSFDIEIGEEAFTKEASVIEDIAYRDTWGRGADSFLSMLHERLSLIHDLLSPNGTIFVHLDYRVGSYVRCLLDEIFGKTNMINEIVWQKCNSKNYTQRSLSNIHDTIFLYAKDTTYQFKEVFDDLREDYVESAYRHREADGRRYRLLPLHASGRRNGETGQPWKKMPPLPGGHWRFRHSMLNEMDAQGLITISETGVPSYKKYLDDSDGIRIGTIWLDAKQLPPNEKVDYPTQKPESVLEKVIKIGSSPGDLVADFFCGSGTTLAVAEKLGRKWIGCDLGRFAIHTTRKRIIGVQRELKAAGQPYRSFEILNLGKYERQYFVGIDPTLPEEQRRAISLQKEEHYLTLILTAYKAERTFQTPPFHGRKSGTLIVVGPIDAPVTQGQVHEAVEAARKLRVSRVDVIGFEFEMGIVPHAQDQARTRGINLSLRYIPKDVFDRRAVEKGQVAFYDVAYVEVQTKTKDRAVTVKLKDFGVYYRQDDVTALAAEMRDGGSTVTVDKGQVVKVTKDKKGVIKREVLTKVWTDWIDYWAVDFHFENRKEIVRVTEAGGSERDVWTGGYIFENEWQSYRTRKDRTLELASAPHDYKRKGRYKIAVKVIDIFGNDTTKVVEVTV